MDIVFKDVKIRDLFILKNVSILVLMDIVFKDYVSILFDCSTISVSILVLMDIVFKAFAKTPLEDLDDLFQSLF